MSPEMTRFISIRILKFSITAIAFLIFSGVVFSQNSILETKIEVPEYTGDAKALIDKIAENEKVVFAYTSKVSLDYEVKFKKQTINLKVFLTAVLEGQPIVYKVKGNKVFLTPDENVPVNTGQMKQTVRGMIIDSDNKLPLIGAAIVVVNSNPIIGVSTDIDGNFRLENIPTGRISLKASFIGYDPIILSNIIVNSAKEVVLNIELQESVISMNEAVIKLNKVNGVAIDEMAIISSRSISTEELTRHAESFNDPSRAMANFAGVTTAQDGSNSIIVRGNSPKYIQWRLEGIEITNPNHFADQNGTGSGGTSTLNRDLLATSDFYTGAFSAEFGDVLSGIYDIRLRNGNNEKNEYTIGVGIMGTDLTAEGPFKKGYAGSYLVNYRYSTVGLVSDLGLVDVTGSTTFQDATFKISLPTKKAGIFSVFGLGGMSAFHNTELKAVDSKDVPGGGQLDNNYNNEFKSFSYLANVGVKHTLYLNESTYLKSSGSFSGNGLDNDIYKSEIFSHNENNEVDSTGDKLHLFEGKIESKTYRINSTLHKKINSKHKLLAGVKYDLHNYDYLQISKETEQEHILADFDENIATLRSFIAWRFRLNKNITFVSGIHNMNVLYNNKTTIEPRAAIRWNVSPSNSLSFGYGMHSNMEKAHNYFSRVYNTDGTWSQPNENLDLLKAHHYVLGYEKHFGDKIMAKMELYYQDLYNLPVENNDTSYYSTINEGIDYNYVELVNEGTGKNYGVEFTLERFFNNNYYWMLNASIFQSKYTALDGIERNTQFNSNYVVNLMGGKDFLNLGKKKNQVLAINLKAYFGGGQKIIPLLRDENGDLAVDPDNNQYYDYSKAYENSIENLYRIDLAVSYKWNKPKTTHELFFDIYDITGAKGKLFEYYDTSEDGDVGYNTQFGLFPNVMYRLYF